MNELLRDYVHRTTHSDYDWLRKGRRKIVIRTNGLLELPTGGVLRTGSRVSFANPYTQPRRRFSRAAKYLVLAGVVAGLLRIVCNVVVVVP